MAYGHSPPGKIMPIVSVIVAAYNCRQTIGRAIESACKQTFKDIEIIVVDDASTDGTLDFVKSLAAKDERIKPLSLPQNGGPAVARNAAIKAAISDWVAVLDADDWYEPQRLEILLKAAKKLNADLVCDNLKIYDHAREEVVDQTLHAGRAVAPLSAEFLFLNDTPMQRHAIGYLKPMIKLEFLRKNNIAYQPEYRAGEDFLLLVEVPLSGGKAFLIPKAYYVYVHRISPTTRKISPNSHSAAGFDMAVKGCDYIKKKYGHKLPQTVRRALEKKRWVFDSRIKCSEMISAIKQKRPIKAFKILMDRPFILTLLAVTAAKIIYANVLVYLPKPKEGRG
jgi:succinoglycan biosynthesis protein ExoO